MLLLVALAHGTEILAGPFVQDVTPTSAWIVWETDDGATAHVEYGTTRSLGTEVAGAVFTSSAGTSLHQVPIDGLQPGATFHYRAVSGDATSDIFPVTLPAPAAAEAPVRMVAMSDMQRWDPDPDVFDRVVAEGVIPTVTRTFATAPHEALDAVLIPGDLVDDGRVHSDWTEDFFAAAAPLIASVPPYPVLGNHEQDDALYYEYFVLPGAEDGPRGERWWTTDLGNVRVIGLDSNHVATYDDQLAWLGALLDATCDHPDIDFVVAQLHHPHRSELWTPGENPFTGLVADALGAFSSRCGIPSVHLYGHTHGYSRGAHPEHQHLAVNVASGGGGIDRWGRHPQANYPEVAVSTDDWGFVLLEFTAADDPTLALTRYSMGDEDTPLDAVVTDAVALRRFGEAPDVPVALWPVAQEVAPDCLTLTAGPFVDPDGGAHTMSQWQVAGACDDFDDPLLDVLQSGEDRYFDVDLAAGVDLTRLQVRHVASDRRVCWRVRYRDDDWRWSPWSSPVSFRLGAALGTPELVLDGSAEGEGAEWTDPDGVLDTPARGDCGLPEPVDGVRGFALGACDGRPGGAISQRVGLASYGDAIDSGAWVAHLAGAFASTSPSDTTALVVRFLDANGTELAASEPLTAATETFTPASLEVAIPGGTRALDVVVTRDGAADTASYADALSVWLGPAGDPTCATAPVEEARACGCAGGGRAVVGPGALLGLLLLRRRRARTLTDPGGRPATRAPSA